MSRLKTRTVDCSLLVQLQQKKTHRNGVDLQIIISHHVPLLYRLTEIFLAAYRRQTNTTVNFASTQQSCPKLTKFA